jgi:hypothetical protein
LEQRSDLEGAEMIWRSSVKENNIIKEIKGTLVVTKK